MEDPPMVLDRKNLVSVSSEPPLKLFTLKHSAHQQDTALEALAEYRIDPGRLEVQNTLVGEGGFGEVKRALMRQSAPQGTTAVTVAVKVLFSRQTLPLRTAFVSRLLHGV